MTAQNYAIVENGIVANVIVWDGNTDVSEGRWEPPAGSTAVALQSPVEIGWTATQGSGGAWTFTAPAA